MNDALNRYREEWRAQTHAGVTRALRDTGRDLVARHDLVRHGWSEPIGWARSACHITDLHKLSGTP